MLMHMHVHACGCVKPVPVSTKFVLWSNNWGIVASAGPAILASSRPVLCISEGHVLCTVVGLLPLISNREGGGWCALCVDRDSRRDVCLDSAWAPCPAPGGLYFGSKSVGAEALRCRCRCIRNAWSISTMHSVSRLV
jgi:hypothetical protein